MAKTPHNTNPDSSEGADGFTAHEDGRADDPGFGADALVIIVETDSLDEQPVGAHTCYCGCLGTVAKGSMYKQGHDAAMKAKLIRAGRAGVEVALVDDGGLTSSDAESMVVSHFARNQGFVDAVMAGINRPAKTKREPGVKNSTKAKVAAVTGETAAVQAKVGRWTYEGTVRNGDFVYASKKDGSPVRVPEGKYTIVD